MLKKLPILLLVSILFCLFVTKSKADDLLDVQNQINQQNSNLSNTQANLAQIKESIASLGNSLSGTQAQLDAANAQIQQIRQQLADAETLLEKKRDTLAYLVSIRNKQIRQIYEFPQRTPLEMFLNSQDLTGFTENLAYQSAVVGDSHSLITLVNRQVSQMENQRNDIQASQDQLEALATQISAKLASLKNSYNNANYQKSYLSSQLSKIQSSLQGLTAQQSQLIAARLAQFNQNQTLGSGLPSSVSLPSPGFNPAYALASYGYPHRVGMNQFGAYGRSLAGQDYQTILHAYYAGISIGSYNEPATITVNGCNDYVYVQCFSNQTFDFEDYLKHIYEMPGSWPLEALKAQAVAARSYAVVFGSPICPNQNCQEIKQEYNTTAWQQAVDATRGIVMTYNGSPIKAHYSSTDGGYTLSAQAVWGGAVPYEIGTKDVAGGGSWPTDAFDGPKYGNSPWFHKAWGDAYGSDPGLNYNKPNPHCRVGTYFPWMTKDQLADIFNALLLSQKNSNYTSQLNSPDGCNAPAGISFQAVKDALAANGVTNVGDIGNIVTGFDDHGNSTSINVVSSNYGLIVFDASKFSSMVFLRSPGSIGPTTSLFDFIICPPTCP